jgi:VCBS repeat-containing protein
MLTISDADSPATFVAQAATAGSYGTFAITSAGAWTYTASSAHNEFVAGTTYTDTFQVASADGTPTSVTINILGTADATNSVPTLTGLATPVTFLENTVNAAAQIIAADVTFTFTDPDSNFDTGTLTVAHLLAEDTVAIRNQGTGAGQIGVAGSDVTFGGTLIGSFAGGAVSTLTVTFNAAATAAGIEALIENLTYANSSDAPTASRSLELKVTDAAGFAATAPIAFAEQTGAANPVNTVAVGGHSTPRFADLDGDGDLDAVVGNPAAP